LRKKEDQGATRVGRKIGTGGQEKRRLLNRKAGERMEKPISSGNTNKKSRSKKERWRRNVVEKSFGGWELVRSNVVVGRKGNFWADGRGRKTEHCAQGMVGRKPLRRRR